MNAYTAHYKEGRHPVLVKEGWSWGAFLFGPLWLLYKRAWIPALLEAALLIGVNLFIRPPAQQVIGFAVAVLAGLLGRDLLRWSLQLRGYALAQVVAARDEESAFVRLLTHRQDIAASTAGLLR